MVRIYTCGSREGLPNAIWRTVLERIGRPLCVLAVGLAVAGCQTVTPGTGSRTAAQYENYVSNLEVKSLPETIRREWQDRANRLVRISREFGVPAPSVQEDLQVAPGIVPGVHYPVPVIRIVYPERTFFDFNSDQIQPNSARLLDVLAESMRRDLPDTQLLILGHTDSVGSDAYNMDLSTRRAVNVMAELASRGVRITQMAAIAVGERQPITTNATDAGRAQNRRVEFMISAFHEANLRLVEEREINLDWLDNHEVRSVESHQPAPPDFAESVAVLRPTEHIPTRPEAQDIQAIQQPSHDLADTRTIDISTRVQVEREIKLREPRRHQIRSF